jgi:alkylation response protein AidB-like acyl-CoA dehydrogenase
VVIDHDQREIVEQVERFARTELHPLQPRMDDEEWWPEHVFPLLGMNGYLGVTAPLYAQLELLRSFTYEVGREVSALARGAARRTVQRRAAAVVLQAGTTSMQLVDRAVQVHGRTGFIWETEVNRLYRAGKLLEIGAGTNEIRRIVIAKELLAL